MSGEVTESASPRRRRLKVARAWQRMCLAEDGGLHVDGRLIVNDLLMQARYFGPQYEIGNPDKTLAMAVRRELVNYLLKHLDFDESKVRTMMEIASDE